MGTSRVSAVWMAGLAVTSALLLVGAYSAVYAPGSCDGFHISPSKAGASYQYAAEGTVVFPSNTMIIGDWNIVDGLDEQGAVSLSEGSTVDVTIAQEPREALSIAADQRPAFQVAYVASDPSRGIGLHVVDEWLDEDTGETIEARMPSVQEFDDGTLHHRHFTKTGWVGLMHAPDVWERSLNQGDRWSVTFPYGFPLPLVDQREAEVVYAVDTLTDGVDGCQAHLRASVILDGERARETTLIFTEDRPVPTTYGVDVVDSEHRFEMVLDSLDPGEGPELSPIDRRDHGPGLGPLMPLEDQFLADADGIFFTDWPTALDAIDEDPEAQTWLNSHPEAAVTSVVHRLGAPASGIENQWTVTWWPGPQGDASMENGVTTRSDPVSDVLEQEITVDTSYVEEVPRPAVNQTFTLSSLAHLHETTYGVPLETFHCNLAGAHEPGGTSRCALGPHDDRGMPRAGGGAGAYFSGLVVDLRDGRVLQETSMAEHLIEPPP